MTTKSAAKHAQDRATFTNGLQAHPNGRKNQGRYDNVYDKWVSVTTAWPVLRLRMEERPRIWRVDAKILNKQLWAADKGWSSSLGVGQGAKNSSP